MLIATLSELYSWGGTIWMHPITFLFLINIGIFAFILISIFTKKQFPTKWIDATKQIAGLALAWGTFSTIVGLFQAFDALENSKDIIPFQMIMGGLKVALITALYGLIVFCISQLAYIIFKLIARQPG
ncbi:MAG: MotA/TolQ/ExbB proton channel family protein [Cyclobacteriaceae bacterium]